MPPKPKYKEGQILTIEVQGLTYVCPPIPALNTIRGYDLPVKDQVWSRRTEHEQWDWNTDPKKGDCWWDIADNNQRQWFEEEIERLHTGDWIMINGVPTYFNNYCYFFHQWHTLQEGIQPIYKETSLEYMRFFEICEKDQFCLGDCGIKGRRLGLSSMSASNKLLIAILESNTLQGIVSKTGTDAQEMYFFVKHSLENLPEFLMPDLNKVTESEIHIAKPSQKITKNNTKASGDKGKNNRVNWLDTSENAYDGRRVRHVTIDEAGKWKKYNVQKCLTRISDTLVVGAMIGGHVSLFTTVNKGDEGGDNFRAIWDNSDHINGKKDRFGRTVSKLKRFFIPAYKGFLGYVGKYGESIIENPTKEQTEYLKTFIDPSTGLPCPDPYIGAKTYLEENRKMLENDAEMLLEEILKNPFTWQEVFKGANNRCNFKLDELNAQIAIIEEECRKLGQKENGRRMSFKKKDSGEKVPVDDPNGMWYILKLIDQPNQNKYHGSIKYPTNGVFGAAGLDTYANAKATVDPGSDACCIIHQRYDALDPENSNMPVAMFLGRPDKKRDFHDQVFWGLEYYGIKLLAERSPTDWEDYAVENRLASELDAPKKVGYLITSKRANGSEVYGIAPQDKEAREQHLTEMKEYALINMHKIKFLRLLKEMVKFDIDERTDYDACMAWGYSLMGLKEWKQSEKVETKVLTFLKLKKSNAYNR
jgi:hypothetical protein